MKYYVILRNRNLFDRAYIDVTFTVKSRAPVPYAERPLLERLRTVPSTDDLNAVKEEGTDELKPTDNGAPAVSISESEETPPDLGAGRDGRMETIFSSREKAEGTAWPTGVEEEEEYEYEEEEDEESTPTSETPSSQRSSAEEGSGSPSTSSGYSSSISTSPSSSYSTSPGSQSESSPPSSFTTPSSTAGVTPTESASSSIATSEHRIISDETTPIAPPVRSSEHATPPSSLKSEPLEAGSVNEDLPERRLSSPAEIEARVGRPDVGESAKVRSSSVDVGVANPPPAVLVTKIARGSTDEPREKKTAPKKKVRFLENFKRKRANKVKSEKDTARLSGEPKDEKVEPEEGEKESLRTLAEFDDEEAIHLDGKEATVDEEGASRNEHLEPEQIAITQRYEHGDELKTSADRHRVRGKREAAVLDRDLPPPTGPRKVVVADRGDHEEARDEERVVAEARAATPELMVDGSERAVEAKVVPISKTSGDSEQVTEAETTGRAITNVESTTQPKAKDISGKEEEERFVDAAELNEGAR